MSTEPKRLNELGGELGQSLDAARGHLPSPESLAGLAERLAELGLPVTDAGAPKPGPELAPAAEASKGLLVKGAAGALATGGVVLTLVLAWPAAERKVPDPAQPRAIGAPARSAAAAVAPGLPSRPAPRPPEASERRTEPAELPPRAPSPEVPSPTPAREGENARAAVSGKGSPVVTKSPPAVATHESAARVAETAQPDPVTGEASAGTAELRRAQALREVQLLKEAREAVASDPERALVLTRRYGAEYPHGTYAQERDFIAISALGRLGRAAEARQRAAAFRERYPRSAYLPQLERLLGGR